MLGSLLGLFLHKSLLSDSNNNSHTTALGLGIFTALLSFPKGHFGDLTRALSLAVIFSLQRFPKIRSTYKTWPHVKSALFLGPRVPFPPHNDGEENPFKYKQVYSDDVKFSMAKSLFAMVVVGAYCGFHIADHIILFPAWIGGLLGAGTAMMSSVLRSGRGDLVRTMGMKIVAFFSTLMWINEDLFVAGKFSSCVGITFAKMMVFDRKHRIKDKLSSLLAWLAGIFSKMFGGVADDLKDGLKETATPF
ncbi:hypothetical protein ScalyP_jg10569 [Parmales sp. scaly parma]|nr:hypothetical protein ScalyP_jg10569 [Parmales sp. scaly parma]